MAPNKLLYHLIPISSFIILFFLASQSFASTSNSISPSTLCKNTPYPSYCTSILPNKTSSNLYDYVRFSIRNSLSQTIKFVDLVDKYLRLRNKLSKTTVHALEDCRMLAGLNIDFLLSSFKTVYSTQRLLSPVKVEEIQTMLSSIITNQETCLDGLQLQTVKNEISVPFNNNMTKLYSVSLALFTKGFVPKTNKDIIKTRQRRRKQLDFNNGILPMRMSNQTRTIYESVSRRKLLIQTTRDEEVVISDMVTVSQDGSGNFTTIHDAINAAPKNSAHSKGYFLIYVKAGVYEEYISIGKNKSNLMMIGDGINQTIITGNRSVVDGWTTFKSATFAVVAPGFVAMNMTFRNTAGAIKHQAVAVRNGADSSTFYKCSFEGYQDTLNTHSHRQFYKECDIYGTVDFIFGNAAVVFQNCNLYPRLPMRKQFNAITAQGRTDRNQNTGIVIHNCSIRAADDLASSNVGIKTYLGRPWKKYSRTIFMQSFMDSLIAPLGWREWKGKFALKTLKYVEYNNTGPGANIKNRVTWPGYHVNSNASKIAKFKVSNFLLADDWLPQTGVPYVGR